MLIDAQLFSRISSIEKAHSISEWALVSNKRTGKTSQVRLTLMRACLGSRLKQSFSLQTCNRAASRQFFLLGDCE